MRANERAARTAEAAATAHVDLRRAFPPRPDETAWPASLISADQIIARIDVPPFRPANGTGYRRHGTAKILQWLADFPGGSWQQRWKASGAEALPKEQWLDLPMQWRQVTGRSAAPHNRDCFQAGLLVLVCADVIRPAFGWMVRKASNWIIPAMEACRDPHGYAALQALIDADPDGITAGQARLALGRITMILACKGGLVCDITVGDYLQLLDAMHQTGTGGAGRLLAYRLLHGLGHLGPDAPLTGRAFLQAAGQRTVEELVDRYQVQCRPVRDLLVFTCGNASPPWTMSPCPSSPGIWSGCSGRTWNATIPGSTRSTWRPRSPAPGGTASATGPARTATWCPAPTRAA